MQKGRKPRFTPLREKINRDAIFGMSLDLPRVVEVELAELRPNPDQPRRSFDEELLQELAASVERHGLLQPITVKEAEGGGYVIVAGERRFRAHQILGRETIFAILTTGHPDEISLIENIQRENLDPLEEAAAMARLMRSHGYTQEELGRVIGKRQSTVSELLRLNALPARVRDEYRTSGDRPSKSLLIEIARLKREKEQLRLWDRVKQGRTATVRAARLQKESGEARNGTPPALKMLAAGRSFVRRLQEVSPSDLVANRDQRAALLQLREQIDASIDDLLAEPIGAEAVSRTG
jgi:ParB family chromosome partitioning protein